MILMQTWYVIYFWRQYDADIEKNFRFACPSVCNIKVKLTTHFFLLTVEYLALPLESEVLSWNGEMSWRLLQENGTILKKKHLKKVDQIFEKLRYYIAYSFIMSLSLLWRHIVLLTVGVYSSNHRVLYTIVISMTRRFQKS